MLEPIGDDGTVTGYRGFVTAFDKATPHRLVAGSMVPQDPQDETVFAPSLGVSSSLEQLVTFARLQLNGGALGGARVAPADLLAQTIRATTAVETRRRGRRPPASAGCSRASTAGWSPAPKAVSRAARALSSAWRPMTVWP